MGEGPRARGDDKTHPLEDSPSYNAPGPEGGWVEGRPMEAKGGWAETAAPWGSVGQDGLDRSRLPNPAAKPALCLPRGDRVFAHEPNRDVVKPLLPRMFGEPE